jgi:sugar lactone lactonase YvrE
MVSNPMRITRSLPRMLFRVVFLCSLCFVSAFEYSQAEYAIDTAVGLHQDRGSALLATLAAPAAVALDASGNVYVADAQDHRVRKVDGSGVIITIAGNGIPGYSGDGGPGVKASLNFPQNLAVDAAGMNVYVADSYNHCVRKVDSAGIITTVAGTGVLGYAGDAGPATEALLACPSGVALDVAGNLYIADSRNGRVRRVSPDGVINTVAGNGSSDSFADGVPATSASLGWPQGLLVSGTGELYIADRGANRIRVVDAQGIINTLAGNGAKGYSGDGGPAQLAALAYPGAVALDATGNVFIADSHNQRIRKVDKMTGNIQTVAGEGFSGSQDDGVPAMAARLRSPQGVAVDTSGGVYIADTYSQRLRKVDPGPEEKIKTVAGRLGIVYPEGGVPALTVRLISPHGVSADAHGNLVVTDFGGHRVDKVSSTGQATTVAGTGVAGYAGNDGAATSASLASPSETAVDEAGNLFIADTNNHCIRKVDAAGLITTVAGTGAPGYGGDGDKAKTAVLNSPYGVAADGRGSVFIADTYNHRIRKLDSTGLISTVAGTGVPGDAGDGKQATEAQLNTPHAVAVDDQGALYIADTHNHRIRKVDSGGTISTIAGNGIEGYAGDGSAAVSASLNCPHGVAVDSSGNVFISDAYNFRIRKVDASGIINTLAGKGISGYGGDGGAASNASLGPPHGIAVDSSGNIFIADMTNGRIRKLFDRTP